MQTIPGSHEDFRWLRLNQRYLSLHLDWSPSIPNIYRWKTLQKDAAPVPGAVELGILEEKYL